MPHTGRMTFNERLSIINERTGEIRFGLLSLSAAIYYASTVGEDGPWQILTSDGSTHPLPVSL